MNIKHENVPGLVQEVVFEINTEDYAEALESALKKQRRAAQIPGFRPGNAPMGLVKKMYERTLMVEEIDKILNANMSKFMEDNKIKYIFEPLPMEGKSKVDFEKPDHFEFAYEYALAPEVKIDLDKLPAVPDFKLIPDEKQRQDYIQQLRERHGNYITPETVEQLDSLSVEYADDKEGFFFLRDMNEDAQAQFIGKKVGDKATVSLKKAFVKDYLLARFLKIKDAEIEADNDYTYELTIKHIGRIEPAELNEDFFKKAFPDGSVKNEDELNHAADKHISDDWQPDLDRQFMNDAITMLIENIDVEMPKDFVRRYVLATQKDMSEETLDKQFDELIKSFKWQMIENNLTSDGDIHVDEEELKDYFRQYFIKNYFGNFNMEDVKERVEELVKQAMQTRDNVKSVYDLLFDQKLTNFLRSKLKVEVKEGSSADYIDMMTKKYQPKDGAKEGDASEEKKPAAKRKPAAKKAETEATAEPKETKEPKEVKAAAKTAKPKAKAKPATPKENK